MVGIVLENERNALINVNSVFLRLFSAWNENNEKYQILKKYFFCLGNYFLRKYPSLHWKTNVNRYPFLNVNIHEYFFFKLNFGCNFLECKGRLVTVIKKPKSCSELKLLCMSWNLQVPLNIFKFLAEAEKIKNIFFCAVKQIPNEP